MTSERARLAALHRLGVLHTPPEAELDEVVALAARLFDVPTALISLMCEHHQWFAARMGFDLTETPREGAFCHHTIQQTGVLLVEDAAVDARFRDSPLVVGEPHIRFYAGAPLITADGAAIGSLCVLDTDARTASPYQQAMLVALADQVVRHLEGHVPGAAEEPPHAPDVVLPGEATEIAHLRRLLEEGSAGYVETTEAGVIVRVNPAAS